jgi:hypothetical protein
MISRKMIQALKELKLEFDCLELVLTQNKEANPISFSGKGYVRQTGEDLLTFKLYSNHTANTTISTSLNELGRIRSGTLYEKSDYYTLQLKLTDGSVWIADDILPQHGWNLDDPNPIVTGKFSSMYSTTSLAKPQHTLHLQFFDEADIPTTQMNELTTDYGTKRTRNQASFRVGEVDFIARKFEDGTFTLRASSSSPLNEYLDIRIEEALRFVLGQSVSWRILARSDGNKRRSEIRSGTGDIAKPRLPPPLSVNSLEYLASGWLLFEKYLEYITTHTSLPFWNDISYHLRRPKKKRRSCASLMPSYVRRS